MPDMLSQAAASWRRDGVRWVLAGLAFDLACWVLVWRVGGWLGLLRSANLSADGPVECGLVLAALVCWGHASVLPTVAGRRAAGPGRLALHLAVAAGAVGLGFVLGLVAGFTMFLGAATVSPALVSVPFPGDGPIWNDLTASVLFVAVIVLPVFGGGAAAAWAMGAAVDRTVRLRRLPAAAGGWAAVCLAPVPWFSVRDAVPGVAPLLVAAAALPWLLLTMRPGAARQTSTGVSVMPAAPNTRS